MPEEITIRITRLPGGAGLPLPEYHSEHASGMDLLAAVAEEAVIEPGGRMLIPTGVAVEIPPGYEAQVRPRSGLALKHGVTLVNTPGTIDADYRGEIGVLLINLGREPFVVKRGDRIAQMVIGRVFRAGLVETDALSDTKRNDGGFGHTG